jgi:hypothetical protein
MKITESDTSWESPQQCKKSSETVKVYKGAAATISFRDVYERYFMVCIINSMNTELYNIAASKHKGDHLDSVVKNLESIRLRDIIYRCEKIFSEEIAHFVAKKQKITFGVVPFEVGICLLLIHRTRITRDNISKRNVNTIDRAVQEHRALKTRPVFFP